MTRGSEVEKKGIEMRSDSEERGSRLPKLSASKNSVGAIQAALTQQALSTWSQCQCPVPQAICRTEDREWCRAIWMWNWSRTAEVEVAQGLPEAGLPLLQPSADSSPLAVLFL